MAKDPKSKKVSKAKAAKNTIDAEIAAEVVDDSKPRLKKGKKPKKTYNYSTCKGLSHLEMVLFLSQNSY